MKYANILIKPVGGMCNLNCKYCFYKDETSKREVSILEKMKPKTFFNLIKKFFIMPDLELIELVFQGGEPTLAGLDFFKMAIDTIKRENIRNIKVNYSIQTNGILINDEWCEFLKENNFLVGISLDGIKETHDKYRTDYNNNGTFDLVLDRITLLEKYEVPYNILTVVNKTVKNNITEIYSFYKEHNFIYQQFIPCLDNLFEDKGKKDYSLTIDDFFEYLNKLFNLYYQDLKNGNYISNRTFDNYIRVLLGEDIECCNMVGHCTVEYVIESNGNVYPCDFYAIDEYYLGNININTIEEIDLNRKKSLFIENSLIIDAKCKSCKFYYLCRGGCRRDKEGKNGIERNFYCKAYYNFFKANINKLIAASNIIKSLRNRK